MEIRTVLNSEAECLKVKLCWPRRRVEYKISLRCRSYPREVAVCSWGSHNCIGEAEGLLKLDEKEPLQVFVAITKHNKGASPVWDQSRLGSWIMRRNSTAVT